MRYYLNISFYSKYSRIPYCSPKYDSATISIPTVLPSWWPFNHYRVSFVISLKRVIIEHIFLGVVSTGLSTYRWHFAVGDRIIRAACVTRGEIRSAIHATDWTEFISVAVAASLAGRLEAGKSAETSISLFKLNFKLAKLNHLSSSLDTNLRRCA